jgi:hypothetical protein
MTEKTTIPPGSPPWVTEEMIADTIRVWQPHYKEQLTEEDALEMLLNIVHLFDALGLTGTADIPSPQPEAVVHYDDHFEELIRKHLKRPGLTPLQEARLYEVLTLEVNPATGIVATLLCAKAKSLICGL